MLVDTVTPDGKKVGKDGKKVDDAWKQAYIQKIKELEASNTRITENVFQIGFVDDDEIPELIYRCVYGESGVMTYYAGKSNYICTEDNGARHSVGYIAKSGMVELSDG